MTSPPAKVKLTFRPCFASSRSCANYGSVLAFLFELRRELLKRASNLQRVRIQFLRANLILYGAFVISSTSVAVS